jgi:hypothetical protein
MDPEEGRRSLLASSRMLAGCLLAMLAGLLIDSARAAPVGLDSLCTTGTRVGWLTHVRLLPFTHLGMGLMICSSWLPYGNVTPGRAHVAPAARWRAALRPVGMLIGMAWAVNAFPGGLYHVVVAMAIGMLFGLAASEGLCRCVPR